MTRIRKIWDRLFGRRRTVEVDRPDEIAGKTEIRFYKHYLFGVDKDGRSIAMGSDTGEPGTWVRL